MTYKHPKSEARIGNYLFTIGDKPNLQFSVTGSNVADITLNTTYFPTGDKDIYLPSNKIETDPLVITFLISEDYSEWLEIYKWILNVKNSASMNRYEELFQTCELTALDSQNQPTVRFQYSDCFPITLEGIQYVTDDENNRIASTTSTLRYNRMKVVTPSGEVITESYGKDQ